MLSGRSVATAAGLVAAALIYSTAGTAAAGEAAATEVFGLSSGSDGWGLTAERRAFREGIRLQPASPGRWNLLPVHAGMTPGSFEFLMKQWTAPRARGDDPAFPPPPHNDVRRSLQCARKSTKKDRRTFVSVPRPGRIEV
jgi:hypothetical protein